MKKMLEKVRAKKQNKKGFTLVEVIVVLVILAIMAAILIPSLVGYIDKARQNSIQSDTRNIVQAAQTLASEAYAKNKTVTSVTFTKNATTAGTGLSSDGKTFNISTKDVSDLSEVQITDNNALSITFDTTKVAKIAEATYTAGGKTCKYNGTSGSYTVS